MGEVEGITLDKSDGLSLGNIVPNMLGIMVGDEVGTAVSTDGSRDCI
jgi:hypothetical protein